MKPSTTIRTITVVSLALTLATLFPATAQAQTTWYVDDDAPNDPGPGDVDISDPNEDGSLEHPFDTIYEATNLAANGDEIILRDGTYRGAPNQNIRLGGLQVTIRSENGPGTCLIDCEDEGTAFNVNSAGGDTTIDGIAVINGGILDLSAAGNAALRNCLVSNCTSYAVVQYSGSLLIRDCCFANGSRAILNGGGDCELINCTLAYNRHTPVLMYGSGTLLVRNSIIAHNRPYEGCEALLMESGGTPSISIQYSCVPAGASTIVSIGAANIDWGANNIEEHPGLSADGMHLLTWSPCRDAGDPNATLGESDIDGESRCADGHVDIGADEFLDTDSDELPDYWESQYFQSPTIALPTDDPDDDRRTNIIEFEEGTDPLEAQRIFYVAPDGDNEWDGLAPSWDGDHGPKATIQAALDTADDTNHDEVCLTNGTYTGPGNRDIDFGGKALRVYSEDGPRDCTIDCESEGRAFLFVNGEAPTAILDGLTIINGHTSDGGGAILCEEQSDPTLLNCILRENHADGGGGAIHLNHAGATLRNCLFLRNSAGNGGAIRANWGVLTASNCNFIGNSAVNAGGVINAYDEYNIAITNCILYDNTASVGTNVRLRRQIGAATCFIVSHSLVAGALDSIYACSTCEVTWLDGNFDTDPVFIDFQADDLRIAYDSDCIDAGTNNPPTQLATLDLANSPRVQDGNGAVESWSGVAATVDVGAYEFAEDTPPLICCSASSLLFEADIAGPAPDPQVISVRSCGLDTLAWTIVADQPWVSIDPPSGQSGGEVADIAISVAPTGLSAGLHTATLQIVDPQASNSPRLIPVELALGTPDLLFVPFQYDTIQAAIDAASDGQTIYLADRLYTGDGNKALTLGGKAITIRSAAGPDNCIIDCENSGRAFLFDAGETNATIIDGITITRGYATGGGAIKCENSSPTFHNCVFLDNYSTDSGGAATCTSSSAQFDDCVFLRNECAGRGGGANCALYDDAEPSFLNCRFQENSSIAGGGGFNADRNSSATRQAIINNCTFINNNTGNDEAYAHGGGARGTIRVSDSTFTGNTSAKYGGALAFFSEDCYCTNSVVSQNHARYGGGITIEGPLELSLHNTTISDNTAEHGGGGVWASGGDACIRGGTIANNTALAGNGGGISAQHLALLDCQVLGNQTLDEYGCGGGIFLNRQFSSAFVNCTIAGNSANHGGGIYTRHEYLLRDLAVNGIALINCLLLRNHAETGGAAYTSFRSGTPVDFSNCILRGNTATVGPQLYAEHCEIAVDFCNVEGRQAGFFYEQTSSFDWGTYNFDADPLFLDANGPDGDPNAFADNDYRIGKGSPCVDAGSSARYPTQVEVYYETFEVHPFDVTGLPRFIDDPFTPDLGLPDPPDRPQVIDIGPHEHIACYTGDLDRSGHVDLADLQQLLAHYNCEDYPTYDEGDLNRDGQVDLADLKQLLEHYGTTCGK